jgi:hypothetical protein
MAGALFVAAVAAIARANAKSPPDESGGPTRKR